MFYVDFLFNKDSPVSRIWLAAHFDKKLSKSQVLDTNILKAIEEILSPELRLAIRLTGYLLLGVSRIYFYKTCYALEDASASFNRLIAPKVQKESRYTETKGLKRIKKKKFSIEFSRLSRAEDITLREESYPISRMLVDTPDESRIPPFEEEVMRSFIGGLEESAFELSRISGQKKIDSRVSEHIEPGFELPQISFELPPERTLLSANDVKLESRKRKARVQVMDNQTLIDKVTFKGYLSNTSSLVCSKIAPPINLNLKSTLINPCIGVISESLISIFNKKFESLSYQPVHFEDPVFEDPQIPVFNNDLYSPPPTDLIDTTVKMTTGVNQTYRDLSQFFSSHETTSFQEFTNFDQREVVCKKFLAILQLYRMDLIYITQDSPYQDIMISSGASRVEFTV